RTVELRAGGHDRRPRRRGSSVSARAARVDGRRRPRSFVATIGRTGPTSVRPPPVVPPGWGKQLLTGWTEEDFGEVLRAGAPLTQDNDPRTSGMSSCPAIPATGVSALGRDGGDARIGGDCCAQSCSDSSSSSAGARMIHSPRTGWRVQCASTTGGIWGREFAGGRRYL